MLPIKNAPVEAPHLKCGPSPPLSPITTTHLGEIPKILMIDSVFLDLSSISLT